MDQEAKARFELVELSLYQRQARKLRRLEPHLNRLVDEEVRTEVLDRRPDLVPGLGGWAKARVPVPSLGIGRRGGFRVLFLFLRRGLTVYLGAIYFKRQKTDLLPEEKLLMRAAAEQLKREEYDAPQTDL